MDNFIEESDDISSSDDDYDLSSENIAMKFLGNNVINLNKARKMENGVYGAKLKCDETGCHQVDLRSEDNIEEHDEDNSDDSSL